MFQSAPPRGGRQGGGGERPQRRGFNPRPRVGGDKLSSAQSPTAQRFQSAPPRGGRPYRKRRIGRFLMFQSAPPRGGRRQFNLPNTEQTVFQSAPPRGGRQAEGARPDRGFDVSIRAPAWGATRLRAVHGAVNGFNPRPRVGGDSISAASAFGTRKFQSAPPRGGRPGWRGQRRHADAVSIRAPAWGATTRPTTPGSRVLVSIRAPAWGATRHGIRKGGSLNVSIRAPAWGATREPRRRPRRRPRGFQSAPPRGGRPALAAARSPGRYAVSIRAPAWGATRCTLWKMPPSWRFQSAPPRGGRQPEPWRRLYSMTGFNPRPRVGGDSGWRRHARTPRGFNPRPRVGGDTRTDTAPTALWFQSAPPRGGRHCGPVAGDNVVSIRAPAWGATRPEALELHGLVRVSIRAPAWGATLDLRHLRVGLAVSIRAPAWGATSVMSSST